VQAVVWNFLSRARLNQSIQQYYRVMKKLWKR
jgi:hypothetical protein